MKSAALVLLLASLGSVGCARPASYVGETPCDKPERTPESVAVLLDGSPARPFRVTGELSAKTLEAPMSVELMRAEAARAGLDGIYWVECSSPSSGRCTAKGFVYTSSVE